MLAIFLNPNLDRYRWIKEANQASLYCSFLLAFHSTSLEVHTLVGAGSGGDSGGGMDAVPCSGMTRTEPFWVIFRMSTPAVQF